MSRVVMAALCLELGLVASTATGGERPAPDLQQEEAEAAPRLGSQFGSAYFARALLVETNRVRRAHGRSALKPRRELDAAADDQAAFMALIMRVQHGSFLRRQATPADRVRRHGLWGAFVAENVAFTPLQAPLEESSVEAIAGALVDQWLKSPGHRENLLNPSLTHFGGSVRLARLLGQWGAYGVQVFSIEGGGLRG